MPCETWDIDLPSSARASTLSDLNKSNNFRLPIVLLLLRFSPPQLCGRLPIARVPFALGTVSVSVVVIKPIRSTHTFLLNWLVATSSCAGECLVWCRWRVAWDEGPSERDAALADTVLFRAAGTTGRRRVLFFEGVARWLLVEVVAWILRRFDSSDGELIGLFRRVLLVLGLTSVVACNPETSSSSEDTLSNVSHCLSKELGAPVGNCWGAPRRLKEGGMAF